MKWVYPQVNPQASSNDSLVKVFQEVDRHTFRRVEASVADSVSAESRNAEIIQAIRERLYPIASNVLI